MSLTQATSLGDAKIWLRAKMKAGANCPCCHQFVKMYERKLYSTIAYRLIKLYRNFMPGEFIHITKFLGTNQVMSCGDFPSKLLYWGLVEEKEKNDGDDKRSSGFWRITPRGIDFVKRNISVMSHIKIYNGKFFGFSGKQVFIDECLGKKFSYSELMGS